MLLLAAAHETGLITYLGEALPPEQKEGRPPLMGSSRAVRQRLLFTLLFLGAVGLHRTWDLRSYTADGLALLTGRKQAYGYRYTEAFLSQLAHFDGAERLTDALAHWTRQLWHPLEEATESKRALTCYVDSHRKPVYSDMLIPRGLVGRLGTILGCRALVLLHDEHGHPLLATTERGDQHLMVGLQAIVARYERNEKHVQLRRIIVDREGMGTEFLARLQAEGRTIVTILRTNQYQHLTSFCEVGTFLPLSTNDKGQIMREVAPARIALPRPDQQGEQLCLHVALIRDLRRLVPVVADPEEAELLPSFDADRERTDPRWWEAGWQATAAPAKEMTAKLIPIVSTAEAVDAVELAQTYIHRWPVQENVIKDYLLPLGLDTNHGFAKVAVENSEGAKIRGTLERKLAKAKRLAEGARERMVRAQERSRKASQQTKEKLARLARLSAARRQLAEQPERPDLDQLARMVAEQERAQTALAHCQHSKQRAEHTYRTAWDACEHACCQQRFLLRELEDLKEKERVMYELVHAKDQVMTVLKLALANVVMWTRDTYFPAGYAHATWRRLAPFFQLAGTVVPDACTVRVELRPFNDRALNRDLAILCERVNLAAPQLPDGRLLSFAIRSSCCNLHAQEFRAT